MSEERGVLYRAAIPLFWVAERLCDLAIFWDFTPGGRRLAHPVALFFWRLAIDLAILCDLMSGDVERLAEVVHEEQP